MALTPVKQKPDRGPQKGYSVHKGYKKKTFCQHVWDPEKKYFLGRNAKSWALILLFYAIFFACLIGLYNLCLQVFLMSLSDVHPRYQQKESLIGTNPGMSFRPVSDDLNKASLVWYKASDKDDVDVWVNLLNQFLEPYNDHNKLPGGGHNQIVCDFNTTLAAGQVCAQDVKSWKECSIEHGYNFNRSSPCFFLKLNRIYNWMPDFYDDVDDLPKTMPDDLKAHIKSLPVIERRQVWVSCNGDRNTDQESVGPIQYLPTRGFPAYFYPYQNTPGYLSPLLVVRFARPAVHRLVNIECRAWAKNIVYRGGMLDRQGSIHLELMID